MLEWTPQRLQSVLNARVSEELQGLMKALVGAASTGRAILLVREPWLQGSCDSKEDDVQDLMVYLLKDDARILRKYGDVGAAADESAAAFPKLDLQRFIIGVAMRFLRKKYASRWRKIREIHPEAFEELRSHLAAFEQEAPYFQNAERGVLVGELERAVDKLSPQDQVRFRMRYIEQLTPEESCLRLGIDKRNNFDQQMSRMQKKLLDLLAPDRRAP